MNHLTVLMAMFPNKIFLDVDDIAKLLNLSKGHIYNLSSQKKLPFKLLDISDKIQVSIVEMAKFLDRKLEAAFDEKTEKSLSVPSMIRKEVPKKRGRPKVMLKNSQ